MARRGPRNVLIRRLDGTRVVRPFRGLRRPQVDRRACNGAPTDATAAYPQPVSLIRWERANIGWLPTAHVLYAEHSLRDRATLLFEQSLEEWLDEQDLELDVELGAMKVEQSARGTSATPGYFKLSGPELLNADPALIRHNLDRLAIEADTKAEELAKFEEALANDFLAVLKRQAPGRG